MKKHAKALWQFLVKHKKAAAATAAAGVLAIIGFCALKGGDEPYLAKEAVTKTAPGPSGTSVSPAPGARSMETETLKPGTDDILGPSIADHTAAAGTVSAATGSAATPESRAGESVSEVDRGPAAALAKSHVPSAPAPQGEDADLESSETGLLPSGETVPTVVLPQPDLEALFKEKSSDAATATLRAENGLMDPDSEGLFEEKRDEPKTSTDDGNNNVPSFLVPAPKFVEYDPDTIVFDASTTVDRSRSTTGNGEKEIPASPIPEPGTIFLVAAGLVALGAVKRKMT